MSLYDPEICYECEGYGDDGFINDEGEVEWYCLKCPFNGREDDDE